jgi:hypothetical protein
MRDIKELKINSKPGPRPVEHDWEAFEEAYDIKVPELLRTLITSANGGGMELNSIIPEGGPEGQMFGVNHFLHLRKGDSGSRSLIRMMEHLRTQFGMNVMPFAEDGGGNVFFLDPSISPASVNILLHDPEGVITITSTLEAFVDCLQINPEAI